MRVDQEIERVFAAERLPGRSGKDFPVFPTSLTRELGEALRELAVREGARRTVETGLGLGVSALFLTAAVGDHVAIDPWQRRRFDEAGLLTLERAGVRERVEFHEEDSKLCLPRLLKEGRSFDLAFVDGDHRFEGAFLDLYFLSRLVRPGGLLVVDDLWLPAVRAAVAYFVTNLGCTEEHEALGPRQEARRGLSLRRKHAPPRVAALRLPDPRPELSWDAFTPFW